MINTIPICQQWTFLIYFLQLLMIEQVPDFGLELVHSLKCVKIGKQCEISVGPRPTNSLSDLQFCQATGPDR